MKSAREIVDKVVADTLETSAKTAEVRRALRGSNLCSFVWRVGPGEPRGVADDPYENHGCKRAAGHDGPHKCGCGVSAP